MRKQHDQPAPEARARGKVFTGMRYGGLLIAALLASTLWVDLPMPYGRANGHLEQPYVPASDRWIELGTPPSGNSPSRMAPGEGADPAPSGPAGA